MASCSGRAKSYLRASGYLLSVPFVIQCFAAFLKM